MTHSMTRALGAATLALLVQTGSAAAQQLPQGFEIGAAEFNNSCASCHGSDAKGAGFLTRVFRGVDPGDLTQLAADNDGQFPFDAVFEVIDGRAMVAAHGDRKMPVWGDRYWETAMSTHGPDSFNEQRARNRVLELVYFLQSIQE